MALCLAIDIGGTKLAVGLVDRAGELVRRDRRPTEGAGAESLFGELAAMTDEIRATAPPGAEIVACGVGCGGPMAAGGVVVSPLNIPAWRDFPLLDRVRSHAGLPTAVDNDAKALALGEGWVGAAVGRRNYMAMVVSTGVGGGIVVDGRLLDGASGNAGHVGHVIVEPEGRPCPCGARGCLEAEASGSGIRALTGLPPERAAPDVIERTGRMVGRAVASVTALLDLEVVTVAGSVAMGFGQPFFAAANAELVARARIAFARRTRIVPAGLGADAPLVGAAAVGWRAVGHPDFAPGPTLPTAP